MHPEDGALLALVEGELRGEALSAVDEHLDECEDCRELVGMLASGTRKRTGQTSVRGDSVGRFLLIEELGRGAMGVVYAGYDPELDRRVAIKVLYGDADTAMGRARLVREAQAMARITHPRVVAVFDVGTRGNDVYVAMELVEGTSLRAWLETKPSHDAILTAFREAGEGLAALHAAGLVHRDFKPENVLVGSGGAKVTDFGLARGEAREGEIPADAEIGRGDIVSATLTRTGAVLGTPAYMAPEQLEGGEVDQRADQFAFCVALWEALYGERPHPARTFAELRQAVASGPPAAPGDKRIGAALRRGLAPDPDARHPDMRTLLDALTPPPPRPWKAMFLAGGVLTAALGLTLGLRESPAEACQDAPPFAALSAAPGLSGAGAPVIPAGARDTLEGWATRWEAARADACDATHERHTQSEALLDRRLSCLARQREVHDAVFTELQGGGPRALQALEVLPDTSACSADRLLDALDPPEAARGPLTALRAAVDRARIAITVARWDDAEQQAEQALEAARAAEWGPATSEARLLRADLLRARGEYDAAYEEGRRALLDARRAGDDTGAAKAWVGLVRSRAAAGRFTEARRDAESAEAAIVGAGDDDTERQALTHVRGVTATNLGDLDAAETDLRASLEIAQRLFGERDVRLAPIHTSLGELHRRRNELDDALAAHREALALDRATFGEAHPRVARSLHNVGGILRRMGRLDEAEASYRSALAAAETVEGDPSQRGLTHNSLGLVASERNDSIAAREHFEAAAAILEAAEHNDAVIALSNLALMDLQDGQPGQARDRLVRAIAMDEARRGVRSERVFRMQTSLGAAQVALGQLGPARETLTAALATARALGDAEDIAAAEQHLADVPREPAASPRTRTRAAPEPATTRTPTTPTTPTTEPAAPTRPPFTGGRTGGLTYGAAQTVE